ncbi:UvrD-helicase domain-containing protein [Glycomyces albidus]|uniref:AAA family ATPase n=1 Tax=Glycomyces albidus TaxID=2656774 RepID=A0A6L5G6K7_9ACTN|nr:UvrD-helicase domain-containing protein [Glycomyces albidus]MQM25253.1 AAA family ATPase [Glycomyces albidus]
MDRNTSNLTAEHQLTSALDDVLEAVRSKRSFKLEAGAGSGKTHALIIALQEVLDNRSSYLDRRDQKIACITYTNTAKDEIVERLGENDSVFVDTLHGFLWELISPYQKVLSRLVLAMEKWQSLIEPGTTSDKIQVKYSLGIRRLTDDVAYLHHDDIPLLAKEMFKIKRFRALTTDRYPIIFIDEYQDTPKGLIETMLTSMADDLRKPVFGFFGDDWQQIYDNTCGTVSDPMLLNISNQANFRSSRSVVAFLNRLRPELPQFPSSEATEGSVLAFHTNGWNGERLKGQWKGQVPHDVSRAALRLVLEELSECWGSGSLADTKVLMLTHTGIANELGYGSLPSIFKYNDSFAKKENDVVAFLVDVLEPALAAYRSRQYGKLFDIIGGTKPLISNKNERTAWSSLLAHLDDLRSTGSVGDIIDILLTQRLFSTPDALVRLQRGLTELLDSSGDQEAQEWPRRILEYQQFRDVDYSEVVALSNFISSSTVFSTQHNVKGDEFSNVVVVVGRGWSKYDFADMLLSYSNGPGSKSVVKPSFVRSRNLFYVASSRARVNLAFLFAQELSNEVVDLLSAWIGEKRVRSVNF